MITPVQRVMPPYQPWIRDSRWPGLGRIILFLLLQMFAIFAFFWAGIFTLIGAIWHSDPNYIWIFLLAVSGFELLALRIVLRNNMLTVLGILLLGCGVWLHHADSIDYNVKTCNFMKHSTCQPFAGGFICQQHSDGFLSERTITRGDVDACAALDEF